MPSIKRVNRISGDWHVQAASDIHLETNYASDNLGTVHVHGNLVVSGETTTIESSNLVISDQILILNKGEIGINNGANPGISGSGISGVSVARGGPASPNYNANLFFNQNKSWTYNGVTTSGIWEFYIGPPTGGVSSAGHSAITTNAIVGFSVQIHQLLLEIKTTMYQTKVTLTMRLNCNQTEDVFS